MPAAFPDAGEFLADIRALEAAGAEMVGLDGDGPEQQVLLGAMAAVTDRIRLQVPGPGPGEMLGKLSRGRAIGETPGETWIAIEMPADRETWSSALREHEAAGATGVIVRWDPRLIDLLRNPEPDDRSDLQMSVG